MDKRIIQQRMRRKKRQLLIRKITRLAACVIATILVLTLLFRLVISPLAGKISGGSAPGETTVEAKAETQDEGATVTTEAVRVPVKSQNNTAKATVLTTGWQEDENGKWYQNPDGTFYANGMVDIDGSTYYMNENGYVQTGWVTIDGVDYSFDDNGVYQPDQQRKMLALTFDDGPGKYTMELLNCLEENGAHATFFMLGQNVPEWTDEVKKMVEIGCEIGNHSYDHPQLTALSGDQVSQQFAKTNENLKAACGQEATVARTPYGAQDEATLSNVGLPCFMWDIDTLDWKTMNADSTYNTTMEEISEGDIILMHDIHQPSVEAAIRLIPDLIAKGYKLVTVSELAKAKGVTLEAGKSYTDFMDATVANLLGTTTDSSSDSSSSSYDDEDSTDESSSDESGTDSSSDEGSYSSADSSSDESSDSDNDSSYDSSSDSSSDSSAE